MTNHFTLQEALATPGRESLLDFYNVGPVQRAWMESFAAALAQQGEPVAGLNRSYTEQLINALHENSDPVSIDAAEEFQRLLAAALAYALRTAN